MDNLEQNEHQFDLGSFVDNIDRDSFDASDEEDDERDE